MARSTDWNKIFAKDGALVRELAGNSDTMGELCLGLSKETSEVVTESGLYHAWTRRKMYPPLGALLKKATAPEQADKALETWRQEQTRKADRKVSQELVKKIHELESQLSVALDTKAGAASVPSVKYEQKKKSGKLVATAVVLASDWHIEEKVDPKAVNDRNEYNLDISRARAGRFFKAILWLLDHNRSGFEIDNLVLWLGGDLISGYIHEELEESNFLAPPEAILYAMDLLVAGIDLLLKDGKLKRMIVPCNRGNHGRIHKKKRISTASANSFEWMLYCLLRLHYKNEPRIEFIVADGDHVYLDVYKYTIRFMHGDTFNYGGGVGGLIIPIRRGVQRLQQYKKADITCLGHFHQLADYGDIVVNGSLIGYSPYALSIAASYEPPQQAFFLIEPNHGKCFATPIWLE